MTRRRRAEATGVAVLALLALAVLAGWCEGGWYLANGQIGSGVTCVLVPPMLFVLAFAGIGIEVGRAEEDERRAMNGNQASTGS